MQSQWVAEDYISAITFIGDTLLAGTDWGVFLSVDTGRTWTSAHNVIPMPASELTVQGSALYACGGGFYRWNDSTMDWNIVESTTGIDDFSSISALVSQGGNMYVPVTEFFFQPIAVHTGHRGKMDYRKPLNALLWKVPRFLQVRTVMRTGTAAARGSSAGIL